MQILRKTINFAATFGETRLKVNGYHRFEWVDIVRFLQIAFAIDTLSSRILFLYQREDPYLSNSSTFIQLLIIVDDELM